MHSGYPENIQPCDHPPYTDNGWAIFQTALMYTGFTTAGRRSLGR